MLSSWTSVDVKAPGTGYHPVQTYSLELLGGLLEMGYLGVGLPLGQDAASMPPPTTSRKAPAQAMKMADPNSYLVLTGVNGL